MYLEVLGLGPDPNLLQMIFFAFFLNKIFSKLGFLSLKTMENDVCTSFGQVPARPHLGSACNPRIQIFPQEYLGTYEFNNYCVFEPFIFLFVLQDKNQMVMPPASPKKGGMAARPNYLIILKTL
jgi:hypothetical protein